MQGKAGANESLLLRILDAGSGMGRSAVFLAELGARERSYPPRFIVDAVDNRSSITALTQAFVARYGVGARVNCIASDIKDYAIKFAGEMMSDMAIRRAVTSLSDVDPYLPCLPHRVVLLPRFI